MNKTIIATAVLAFAVSSAAWAAPQTTAADPATATGESAQPVGDTWITTKVKTELAASSEVPATDISVETVNGVVMLSGHVTKAQATKAAAIAKNIDGVKKVDTSGLMASGKKSAHK